MKTILDKKFKLIDILWGTYTIILVSSLPILWVLILLGIIPE